MDDWDTVTKIGKSVNRGGASGPRETVVRGKSAINAAQRSGGILATEKKFTTGNNLGKGQEGQRAAKLDRETDVGKTVKVLPKEVRDAMQKARNGLKMSADELGKACQVKGGIVLDWESGRTQDLPSQTQLGKMEKALKVKLRGKDIGAPFTFGPKKKAGEAAEKK